MIFNRREKEDETGLIKNMSGIDLRDATAESLAEIKGIKNVGIIILPTDAEPRFFANYAKIPKKKYIKPLINGISIQNFFLKVFVFILFFPFSSIKIET